MKCVYVMIGQKRSEAAMVIDLLRRHGALAYTTVVVGEATATPGMKYLAPFAGCAVAEGWMRRGEDTLVIYDDLTTHARAYRELSLLMHRPPGREAYPGDIFYLHARLLERSTRLAPEHGGGSLTALPIVETEEGEIAAYIPTNLISITDGQIYLDRRLFAAGVLPAVDVPLSVSRIGGKAQHPRIKEEAGRMKLDYLQFLELEIFTRFGTKLEAGTEAKIRRGRLLREILKQERLSPLAAAFQLAWMIAFNEGLLDACEPQTLPDALQKILAGLAARAAAPGCGPGRVAGQAEKLARGHAMSGLAELSQRFARLKEISGIMTAMKSLSLVETRKLARFIGHQRRMLANIEAAAADFLHFFPVAGAARRNRTILLLIGSERGFCGNFNERVLAALDDLPRWEPAPTLLVVGHRLGTKLEAHPDVIARLDGATVTEDVPAVLNRLMDAVHAASRQLSGDGAALFSLAHDAEGEPTLKRLLPLAPPQPPRLSPSAAPATRAGRVLCRTARPVSPGRAVRICSTSRWRRRTASAWRTWSMPSTASTKPSLASPSSATPCARKRSWRRSK